MIKFKIIFIIFSIIIFILSFNTNFLSIGTIWKKYHVNSLIGLQKFLEQEAISKYLPHDTWYTLILPLLEQPFIFLILLLIFIVIIIKY